MSYYYFIIVAIITLVMVAVVNNIAKTFAKFKFGNVGKEIHAICGGIDGLSAIVVLLLALVAPLEEIVSHPGTTTFLWIVIMLGIWVLAMYSDVAGFGIMIVAFATPFLMAYLWHDVLVTVYSAVMAFLYMYAMGFTAGLASEERGHTREKSEVYYTYEEER